MNMVADTQAIDLLQELENRNITPIDNQAVADGGLTDNVSSLLGAIPGAETIILEQLAPALPETVNTHEETLNANIDPILGMDL